MNITYDKQADALYLRLREGKAARQRIYTDDVIVDLDDAGNPLGIEVLDLTAAVPPLTLPVSYESTA